MSKHTTDPSAPDLEELGRYKILAHIATGGMGAVYKARDTRQDRIVALKVLPPSTANNGTMIERFRREARNAARFRHPNIVELYEIDHDQDTWFLAMEYVEGIDLLDYITQKGQLSPKEARRLLFQAAQALRHAHKHGIVHRDIKPSNFLLTVEDGKPVIKLTDFGLARVVNEDDFRITRDGNTVGTVDYISPEQARDSRSADIRSDIYSLGCTFYHMLAGHAPFCEGGLAERLYKHVEEPPPDIRQFSPTITTSLEAILLRMLAKKPEDRYQTPKELLEAIARKEETRVTIDTKELIDELAEEEPEEKVARPLKKKTVGPRLSTNAEQKVVKPRSSDKKKRHSSTAVEPVKSSKALLWISGAVGLVALLAVGIIAFSGGKDNPQPKAPTDQAKADDSTPPIPPPPRDGGPPVRPPVKKDGSVTQPPPVHPTPKREWPLLSPELEKLDVKTVEKAIYEDWKPFPPVPKDVLRLKVSRFPQGEHHYGSLKEAIQASAKSEEDAIVIEVEDNGPLYTGALALKGKTFHIRSANGFRPLIVWHGNDRTLMAVENGSLHLQGIDFVKELPKSEDGQSRAVVDIRSGSCFLEECSFSIRGIQPRGTVIARFSLPGKEGARCHIRRCYSRGLSLKMVETVAPGMDVLIEECLTVAGEQRLVGLTVTEKASTRLRMVQSTLVGRESFLQLIPENAEVVEPLFRWQIWSSVVARSGRSRGGALFSLTDRCVTTALKAQSWNSVFTGWQTLFQGQDPLTVNQHSQWQFRWGSKTLDRVSDQTWPPDHYQQVAEIAAVEHRTNRTKGAPVGYGAIAHKGTIGAPMASLPEIRSDWRTITVERFIGPPPKLLEDEVPEIPRLNDGRYHGGSFDLSKHNVGAILKQIKEVRSFGPRVVLYLYQSDYKKRVFSDPLLIKDANVILYLAPVRRPTPIGGNKDDERVEPLRLIGSSRAETTQTAFIEVENGNLEIIRGTIRLPDFQAALIPPYLIRVKGGSLKVLKSRLEGPRYDPPRTYQGLILFEGGMAKGEPFVCQLDESVLLTSRDGLHVRGSEATVRMEQSVVVTPGKAIRLEPGEVKQGWKLYCGLERSTFAAGEAVVLMESAQGAESFLRPGIIQTRSCAYLNPFGSTAGVFLYEQKALQRGQALWQSGRDVFDPRLHFRVARTKRLPQKPQEHAQWLETWGPPGDRQPVVDLPLKGRFAKDQWDLRLLQLPASRSASVDVRKLGADLSALGLVQRSR